jgi:hypothetical protein
MSEEFTQRVPRKFLGKYRPKIDGLEKASETPLPLKTLQII